MDQSENQSVNPTASDRETISDLVARRMSRRNFLAGASASAGLLASGCATPSAPLTDAPAANANPISYGFKEISRSLDERSHIPEGYVSDLVIRWGDALFADSPTFDPANQTAAAQKRQFGYNNDYIGFVPLNEGGSRGLLCVNHEYTSTALMLPGVAANYPDSMTQALCEVEMAAHGGTIVEVVNEGEGWRPVVGSAYNRRLMAYDTPMEMSGPAAGHARLRTSEDPDGQIVDGTLNNCAGGITPWGTYLMAEENFNGYFSGSLPDDHPERVNHDRYGVPGGWYAWGRHFDRFDISKEPNEPNRHGWVVEVDPMDPDSMPKKRTALGRFKHEGAESVIAPDGRLVVYMGDDQRFDYVYKFVSAKPVDQADRAANRDLLDDGVLYVARFSDDGAVDWMPLVWGEGPLTPENGFGSQAEVMIETRRAADLLGATPMDRPEDIQPDSGSGSVWLMLTNNSRREADQTDAANPRGPNLFGHIIEIIEPNGDFTATRSRWDMLVLCGDPDDVASGARWSPMISANGWYGSPDNCAIDASGRLWVSTDGNDDTGAADGIWAMETEGPARGYSRAFFRAPIGAEVCGPRFTADSRTLFLAVQHPGDGEGASYENPTTRWPDFQDGAPPRPSVLAVRKRDGGVVGS